VDLAGLLVRIASDAASILLSAGAGAEAAGCVGRAMECLAEAMSAGRDTEGLRMAAAEFFRRIVPHVEALTTAGLDGRDFDDVRRRFVPGDA